MTNADGPVPRLRFPEFRGAGPWEAKRLGEALDYKQPGPFIVSSEYYGKCGIPVLTPGKSFILGHTTEQHGIFRDIPAILFDDFTTDSKYVDFSFKIRSSAIKILKAKPGYSLKFTYETMQCIDFDASMHKRHWIGEYQNLTVPFPSLPEQQKIADCLTSLDDLIRAEGERLEALKAHKRGLMQQLFPRPGETTPRLRFPEFRDAGPWEVKRLGDEEIANFVRNRIAAENIPSGHYVSTVNLLSDFGGLSQDPEVPPSGNAIAYDPGDILISNIRPYLRKIWVADRSGGASNDVIVVRPSNGIFQPYLGQLLRSERFISHIMDGAKGVKMPRGDLEQIQDFEVPLCPKPEQHWIADCLTSLDDLIRAEGERLEALKAHRRALMQQLFPQGAA